MGGFKYPGYTHEALKYPGYTHGGSNILATHMGVKISWIHTGGGGGLNILDHTWVLEYPGYTHGVKISWIYTWGVKISWIYTWGVKISWIYTWGVKISWIYTLGG